MTSRRQFLTGCSALTLTASLAPACLSDFLPVRKVTLDRVSFTAFSAHVGQHFRVVQKSVALKLVEAKLSPTFHPPGRVAEDAGNEKFSLRFIGPKAGALTQDTYAFEHSGIGCFAMFIVPAAEEDSRHACYHAIFNRPTPQTST
jgi:hypothetical protein